MQIIAVRITAPREINAHSLKSFRNICLFFDGSKDDGSCVPSDREIRPTFDVITIKPTKISEVTEVMIQFPDRELAEVPELRILYTETGKDTVFGLERFFLIG